MDEQSREISGDKWWFSFHCGSSIRSSKWKQMRFCTNIDHVKGKLLHLPIPHRVQITKEHTSLILKYIHVSVAKFYSSVPCILWRMFGFLAWEQWRLQYSEESRPLYVCHNSCSGPGLGSTFKTCHTSKLRKVYGFSQNLGDSLSN